MQLQTEILVLVNSRLTDVNLDSIQPIHLTLMQSGNYQENSTLQTEIYRTLKITVFKLPSLYLILIITGYIMILHRMLLNL